MSIAAASRKRDRAHAELVAQLARIGRHSGQRVAALRQRETATEAMIRQIDEKVSRLGSARRERIAALERIRAELVRASTPAPAVAERYECEA